MFNKLYSNINNINNSLNLTWKKNELITNNISNVNTPGYKKMTLDFQNVFNSVNRKSINMKITDSRHINIINENNDEFKISRDNNSVRKDGNNVNIDVEMAELTKNTILYNSLIKQASNEFNKIKMVVNEGR